MKNAVTVAAPTLPGLLPNAEVKLLADSFRVEDDMAGKPTIDRFPTVTERTTLAKRTNDIERALRPISADLPALAPDGTPSSDKRIAAMFLGKMFRGWNITDGTKVSDFLDHLSEHPLFAIEKACRDATSRRLTKANGDPIDFSYPPPSSALGAACARHSTDLFFEKSKIEKILHTKKTTPPPPTKQEKEKMQGQLRELASAMQMPVDEPEHIIAEKAQAARENAEYQHRLREREWVHLGYEPLPSADGSLSAPSMLKSVGRWPPKGAVKIKKRVGA